MNLKSNVKMLVFNAVIAAIYAVLTVVLEPISYGAVQFRFSEVITLLAFVNFGFVPGLLLGCALANLFSPLGIIDVFVGTFATFVATYPMRYCKNIFVASLLPVIANGIIIGIQLTILFELPLLASILSVAAGEFGVVCMVGVPIYYILQNRVFQNLKTV